MKNFAIVTISILALALMPACESDSSSSSSDAGSTATDTGNTGDTVNSGTDAGSGTGTGFSTGLDGALALSDLTDEQQIAACEAGDAYFMANHDHDTMQKMGCVMAGMMAGMMGATCQEAYDACMADPQPMEETDCSEDLDDLSGCTDVTVAETEACINADWVVQMEAMTTMAAMTCDDIEAAMSDPEGGGMMEEPPTPAECEGLEDKCPAFFADEDDM